MNFDTPILFIIFNRPDTTKRVFEAIRKLKPLYLYVAADGPRLSRPSEKDLCQQTRNIIKLVDWPCKVNTLFQDNNLGCKMAVCTAITWFFNNVKQGIVLEDDCLPNPSFFPYCSQLLDKYANDKKIMTISGDNFQIEKSHDSYYFSKYSHIWGWASWARAWKHYDVKISTWPETRKKDLFKKILPNMIVKFYWYQIFDLVHNNKINTWDYQWLYCIWKNNGITIIPSVNLISNIGFGNNPTHTYNKHSSFANMETYKMTFPLLHPKNQKINIKYDNFTEKHHFKINLSRYLFMAVYHRIFSIL
ncbi:MAG: glycosyltransferase family 2 protein [Candidatus Shapirobacteria bacterium]|jgi:hypothetical protein